MRFKRMLTSFSVVTLIASTTISVACTTTKTNVIKQSEPLASWINNNSWTSYILNNPNGESLDIPEMYNASGYEDSNKLSFTTNMHQFEISYKDLIGTKLNDSIKKLKELFLLKNKFIKGFLNKHSQNKYVAYFSHDVINKKLLVKLKELKSSKDYPVQKLLDSFSPNADIDAPDFPEFHGHPMWTKAPIWFVFENKATGKIKKQLFPKSLPVDFNEFLTSGYNAMSEQKLRLIDKNDPNTTFTLDARQDTKIKSMPESNDAEKKAKQKAEDEWFKKKIDTYFLNSKALLTSYPYIDFKTNKLKVMLISSDENSTVQMPSEEFSASPPYVLSHASNISYKVITVENVLPSTVNSSQKISNDMKTNIKNLLKSIFQWLAINGGTKAIPGAFLILKDSIPYLQILFENLFPIFDEMQKQYEESGLMETWKEAMPKLNIYKNLDKEIILNKIVEELKKNHFNFDKIKKISQNTFKLKANSREIDFENSPFVKWNLSFLTGTSGRNQNLIMDVFWLLKSSARALI